MGILNLVQFIQLPFAVIPLLKMYYSPSIMEGFKISKCKFCFVVILSVVIQVFNIFSIYGVIKDSKVVYQVLVWVLIAFHTIFIGNFFLSYFFLSIDLDYGRDCLQIFVWATTFTSPLPLTAAKSFWFPHVLWVSGRKSPSYPYLILFLSDLVLNKHAWYMYGCNRRRIITSIISINFETQSLIIILKSFSIFTFRLCRHTISIVSKCSFFIIRCW